MSRAEWIELPTRDEIANALHGDNCPDDPDPDEYCSCGAGDYDRMGDIVLDLLKGKAMVRALPDRDNARREIAEALATASGWPGRGDKFLITDGLVDAVLALLKETK